jgi:diacylglycerol kinase family enzyme
VIERGRPWGEATSTPPDVVVRGGDRDLAAAVTARPDARFGFVPDATSDLARALGLPAAADRSTPDATSAPSLELPVDVLALDDGIIAVNAVVLGAPPAEIRWITLATPVKVTVDDRVVFDGRATTVLVANGEFLDGDDLVRRGHPGDGRAEVQVFAVARRERRAMRGRLATGAHVPHPGITQASGRVVVVEAPSRLPVAADRRPQGARATTRIEVRQGALRLVR